MACAYQGCEQRYQTFTSINFFYLPNDKRRDIWIKNSGNSKLKTIPSSKKVRFCDAHFEPKYFRRQFNRTTLRPDAVPYSYYEINGCCPSPENRGGNTSVISIDMSQDDKDTTITKNDQLNESIELVTVVDLSKLLHTDNQPTFSNESLLDEDYLEDQTELVEIIQPINHVESVTQEIISPEIEKTRIDGSTQTDNLSQSNSAIYDEDEHFVLSLVGPLRRLPNFMKISARLLILEIIARCESQTK